MKLIGNGPNRISANTVETLNTSVDSKQSQKKNNLQ